MKTLLFLGHEYHRKTGSAQFLVDLLRRGYEVAEEYVDLDADPSCASLSAHPEKTYDVLVCMELLPRFDLLRSRISFRQGVFFPMYDWFPPFRKMEHWFPYRHFQFICFCRELHRELLRRGFCSHYVQFFPAPAAAFEPGDPTAAFFWNRQEAIHLRMVQRLLSGSGVRRIHLHKALDPGQRFVEPEADPTLQITCSSWYPDKAGMLAEMRRAALYIAPRRKEGIGMSFLEAMAQGRCVIAPDCPTMNEYIADGRTGILYDPDCIQTLALGDVAGIQQRAWEFIRRGYAMWLADQHQIPTWIAEPPRVNRARLLFFLLWRCYAKPSVCWWLR